MKTILSAAAILALAFGSGQAVASPQGQGPAAAATLPNAFDGPAPSRPTVPPPPTTEVQAPDVARSEAALRSVIAAFQAGQPDYSVFTEGLSARIREKAGEIGPLIQGYGAVQSVTFAGEQNGAELFSVVFAGQRTMWLIGFDDEDRIAALLFRPVEAAPAPQS